MPVEEIVKITKDWAQPPSAGVVKSRIEKERRRVATKALKKIVKRAEDGDIAAVRWLEEKHVLMFPAAESIEPLGFVVV